MEISVGAQRQDSGKLTLVDEAAPGPDAPPLVSVFVDADFHGPLLSHGFSSRDAIEVSINLIVNSVSDA